MTQTLVPIYSALGFAFISLLLGAACGYFGGYRDGKDKGFDRGLDYGIAEGIRIERTRSAAAYCRANVKRPSVRRVPIEAEHIGACDRVPYPSQPQL